MTTECDRQISSEQEKRKELAASLRRLLEEQLAAGRKGNLPRVERLGERANAVVEAIVQCGGPVWTDVGGGQDLGTLYGELTVLLRAQRADAQGRLQKLRQVKRALGAYGANDKSVRKPSSRLG
jgi:hypothetical protein